MCGFRVRSLAVLTLRTLACSSHWTHFEGLCALPAASRRGVQCHQPALHRAHALGLGSVGEPRWKQIGKAQNKEIT